MQCTPSRAALTIVFVVCVFRAASVARPENATWPHSLMPDERHHSLAHLVRRAADHDGKIASDNNHRQVGHAQLSSDVQKKARVPVMRKVPKRIKEAETQGKNAQPFAAIQFHMGQVRSYVRDVSNTTLALVALSTFVLGMVLMIFVMNPDVLDRGSASGDQGSSMGQPLTPIMGKVASGMFSRPDFLRKFDFETFDAERQLTKRWQWCTEKECRSLGVSLLAPVKAYKNHDRIDVDPLEQDVEALLVEAKVDLSAFDFATNIEALLWKMLRHEVYFMQHETNMGVLLMVETVRIRWRFNDHILIEKCDDTFIGAALALPGVEKPASESAVIAARREWTEVLKLPEGSAIFMLDSTEDKEIEGFRGLRCVERQHFVEVLLHTEDMSVFSGVGLPNYTPFTTTNDSGDEERVKREFTWMTIDEAKSAGVHMPKFGQTSCVELQDEATDAERVAKLKKFLNESGLDTTEWESETNKGDRLAALAKELVKGTCVVNRTSEGVHRDVTLVAARIRSPDGKFVLVEKGCKYPSGSEEWAAQLPGSKKDDTERMSDSILRNCERHFGFSEDDITVSNEDSWEYYDYTEISNRYKGLPTKYQKFLIDVHLEDDEGLLKRVGLGKKHVCFG